MHTILKKLMIWFSRMLRSMPAHFYLGRNLWNAGKGIPLRYLAIDFISILRSVAMFVFFDVVAVVVFTMLPQGQDVLLLVTEDIIVHKAGNLICLLAGIFFWSIVSEYGTRYSIYVSDNSGTTLSDQRVAWRKALQKAIAGISLSLPYLIVLAGFITIYLQHPPPDYDTVWAFAIPVTCLIVLYNIIAGFYFVHDSTNGAKRQGAFYRFALMTDAENNWCRKLYGIYNRYEFKLRTPDNFTGTINGPYEDFCKNFSIIPAAERDRFPQNPEMISENILVPAQFKFHKFIIDKAVPGLTAESIHFRWQYAIPLSYFKTLHRQMHVIVLFSVCLLVTISFLPVQYYTYIGAPGLVVFAFGCWSGLYTGLLYVDFALLRYNQVSLRFILLVMLIVSSFVNQDHPVRYNNAGTSVTDTRPGLRQHFLKWFRRYEKDSLHTLFQLKNDTTPSFYPVVFVCAEGGALRTGAFTAQALGFLQDSIQQHYHIDIRKSLYAFSGVSGGSVGVCFYNAAAYLTPPANLRQHTSMSDLTRRFFNEDYLAPVIGKMFYAEIINLFIPFHIQRFDRAIAIEQAWELGFKSVIKSNRVNPFSTDFNTIYRDTSQVYPAVFINTTEIESGRQCFLSNIRPDNREMVFADKRDLLHGKIKGGINYSTMTNFSSRFPLFSPAAALIQDKKEKYHYVDGGYVENTGAGTMLEVLRSLQPVFDSIAMPDYNPMQHPPNKSSHQAASHRVIKPFVLILQYNRYLDKQPGNINFANEVTEIINGFYNTGFGRSATALEELKRYTRDQLHGEVMVLPLLKSGSDVPMNWVLSNKSLNKIAEDINKKWDKRDKEALKKFFAIDTNCITSNRWRAIQQKATGHK